MSVLCAFMLFTVAACVGVPQPVDNLPAAPKNVTPVMIPAAKLEPYKMQIGDVLDIKLPLNPELNEQVVVRPDGMISTSMAQDVMAYDRTPAELQEELTQRYGEPDKLQDPELSVIVRSFAPTRVYVLGEVNEPGEFVSVGPPLTVLQAIARAGGLKNSAQTKFAVILRRGAGDDPTAYSANYVAALTGEDAASDVRLAPYDVLYVPRTPIGDLYLNYQQYVQQFVPPAFGLNYQLNPQSAVSSR